MTRRSNGVTQFSPKSPTFFVTKPLARWKPDTNHGSRNGRFSGTPSRLRIPHPRPTHHQPILPRHRGPEMPALMTRNGVPMCTRCHTAMGWTRYIRCTQAGKAVLCWLCEWVVRFRGE